MLLIQGVEDDDLIHPVQELGAEGALQLLHHPLLHGLVIFGSSGRHTLGLETHPGLFPDQIGAHVGGHDHHGVAHVHRTPPGIGQPSVLDHLQQDVEHVRVRLLDLVEQHHRVRVTAYRLGQLPGLLVADVARRSPQQAGDRMLLHVLGHVKADDGLLVPEQRLCQGAGQLRLADAGGPEEDEGADRALGVFQSGTCPPDRPGHGGHRVLLADHPLVQHVLHVQQALGFILAQFFDRYPGPTGDDGGDVLLGDDRLLQFLALVPVVLDLLQVCPHVLLLVAESRRLLELLSDHGGLLLLLQQFQLFLHFLDFRRGGEHLQPHPGGRLVHQVDGLVRQEAFGDVALTQPGGCLEGVVGDLHPVVRLVAVPQAA